MKKMIILALFACTCSISCNLGGDEGADKLPQEEEVIFTEIMADPQVVPDDGGEWFELHNLSSRTITLTGCVVTDGAANNVQIEGDLELATGQTVVLASGGSPGFLPDYDYGGSIGLSLDNDGDSLSLLCNGVIIDTASYLFAVTGRSIFLDPLCYDAQDNDDLTNWWPDLSDSYNGDYGTPGSLNGSPATDPAISPSAGPAGTAFTIVDPLGRIEADDAVLFYSEGADPAADGRPAENVAVSADGRILTGNSPGGLGPGDQHYVAVRDSPSDVSKFGDLPFMVEL
jgi:hypothetical protein